MQLVPSECLNELAPFLYSHAGAGWGSGGSVAPGRARHVFQ